MSPYEGGATIVGLMRMKLMDIDVWALGVLLYKLCYYTTPFEEHGPLAIVNAKYTFPPYPVYSPLLQHLIGERYLC